MLSKRIRTIVPDNTIRKHTITISKHTLRITAGRIPRYRTVDELAITVIYPTTLLRNIITNNAIDNFSRTKAKPTAPCRRVTRYFTIADNAITTMYPAAGTVAQIVLDNAIGNRGKGFLAANSAAAIAAVKVDVTTGNSETG